MQPFLRWAGGKRWLVPKLKGSLPSYRTYYEPLLGGGSLFFSLEPERAVLSDANPELINCYRRVRNQCEDVILALKPLRPDERTYYRVRERVRDEADPVKRAAQFVFLNAMCWNGLYRVNRRGEFNVPIRDISRHRPVFDPEKLRAAGRALRRAKLRCCDFEDAALEAKRGDLVYLDPPYVTTHSNNAFIKYNARLFGHADEMRLAAVAERLLRRGIGVLVTNAAHPFIREQYNGSFFTTEVTRASRIAADPSKRRTVSELMISSFPLRG